MYIAIMRIRIIVIPINAYYNVVDIIIRPSFQRSYFILFILNEFAITILSRQISILILEFFTPFVSNFFRWSFAIIKYISHRLINICL